MSTVVVSYAAESRGVSAHVVHTWKRGDISGQVMSASSGPKDYVRNAVWEAFEQDPEITAITMVVARQIPICIRHRGGRLFDSSGEEVYMEPLNGL